MIPITRLQKELTQTVRELSDTGNAVFVLKNSNIEAVLIPYSEYEYLKNIEEVFEQREILNMIEARSKQYDPQKNVDWEHIQDEG
jgi:PHD/YefM family antitoxin component YafN of YafNO toxin-antitoxin module